MNTNLNDITNNLTNIANTAPEIYNDVLKEPLKQGSKLIGNIPRFINALFSDAEIWMLNREYTIEETKRRLNAKLENIPNERIVEPQPYVFVPTLQALSYSIDNKTLRNLYVNLLTKSMIREEATKVHPSFVNIIKDLSPLDALVFKEIMLAKFTPLIQIGWFINGSGWLTIQRNITWLTLAEYPLISMSIDNLTKHNLIYISNASYTNDSDYKIILDSEEFKSFVDKIVQSGTKGQKIAVESKNFIEKTDLGNYFYDVCVKDLEN